MREHGLALELGVADAYAVDARPVHRAGVDDAPDAVLAREAAVEARDRRIVEDEVVRRVRADPADVAVVHVLAAARGAGDALDRDLEPRRRDLDAHGGVVFRERAALVAELVRCRAHVLRVRHPHLHVHSGDVDVHVAARCQAHRCSEPRVGGGRREAPSLVASL